MHQTFRHLLMVLAVLLPSTRPAAGSNNGTHPYRNHTEIIQTLEKMRSSHSGTVVLHTLAQTPGGLPLTMIEIGHDLGEVPAVFVMANPEGITPLATEGALRLAQFLADSARYREKVKWYILPSGNPDAAKNFFSPAQMKSTLNGMPVNIDTDDQVNEDGYEDLNHDGYITRMRKRAPDGDYRVSEEDPRLMVRADPAKGERGTHKLYSEGIDNDGDGLYNEDEPGGINPGINYPHDFQHFVKEAGLWPGQAPETFGVMQFIYNHPEIVMTITLGESNLLAELPQEGKTDFDPNRIRIPERLARQSGLLPTRTYTMNELLQTMQSRFPDILVTENMVLGQLNLGPELGFRKNDILWYEQLSKEYKKAMADQRLNALRLPSEKPRPGSFELWSYFHLGVPSIALSLWEPEAKKDTTVSANDKSASLTAAKKTSAEKQMLDYFDQYGITGFAEWKPFNHPQLGEVEIGGFLPYAANTPPSGQADGLITAQIPFIAALAGKLHDVSILEEKVTSLGAGVFRVEIFIENKGYLPCPTDMGIRNQQPAPVVLILEGKDIKILEGLSRTPVHSIGGNQVLRFSWVVHTPKSAQLTARLESPVVRNQTRQIVLK